MRGTGRDPHTSRGLPTNRGAVSAFLRSRRGKITPEQAGLPAYGQRRVPGLRGGEVATLAGVSVEYYTRVERGNLRGVSDSVLNALARALRLDGTERMYLYDLARAAGPDPGRGPGSGRLGRRCGRAWRGSPRECLSCRRT